MKVQIINVPWFDNTQLHLPGAIVEIPDDAVPSDICMRRIDPPPVEANPVTAECPTCGAKRVGSVDERPLVDAPSGLRPPGGHSRDPQAGKEKKRRPHRKTSGSPKKPAAKPTEQQLARPRGADGRFVSAAGEKTPAQEAPTGEAGIAATEGGQDVGSS